MLEYIINKTLLAHQLIDLKKFDPNSTQSSLNANKNIKVMISDDKGSKIFPDCHIDPQRRLRLPLEAILWVKRNFPFSVAFCSIETNEVIWTNKDTRKFHRDKKNNNPLEEPAETLYLSWVQESDDCSYLLIQKGFQITIQNMQKVLSAEAMATVLPYIFSSVENTSFSYADKNSHNSKKAYIIDQTTPWLSVKKYSETAFAHPGLYLLRRQENDSYYYYIGKAVDIKNRIIKNKDSLCHPEEKNEDNKLYTEIACLSLNFDDIIRMYQNESDFVPTAKDNPAVASGSKFDAAIFAIEDIAIHVVSMILQGEGKKLDNKQYRSYTSEALMGSASITR